MKGLGHCHSRLDELRGFSPDRVGAFPDLALVLREMAAHPDLSVTAGRSSAPPDRLVDEAMLALPSARPDYQEENRN
jgi:hypothetical protein